MPFLLEERREAFLCPDEHKVKIESEKQAIFVYAMTIISNIKCFTVTPGGRFTYKDWKWPETLVKCLAHYVFGVRHPCSRAIVL